MNQSFINKAALTQVYANQHILQTSWSFSNTSMNLIQSQVRLHDDRAGSQIKAVQVWSCDKSRDTSCWG